MHNDKDRLMISDIVEIKRTTMRNVRNRVKTNFNNGEGTSRGLGLGLGLGLVLPLAVNF